MNPLSQTNSFYGVTFGNSTFVAVTSAGTIFTSPDGSNWTLRDSGTTSGLQNVTYGNGIFVAVGSSGTILTSAEGVDWTLRDAGTSRGLVGVVYGNGIFVATGFSGTVLTSAEGINWIAQDSQTGWDLRDIAYGNSTFVALGSIPDWSYDSKFYTSIDGENWISNTYDAPLGGSLKGLTYDYDCSKFVAGGDYYQITTSKDGVQWTSPFRGGNANLSILFDVAEGESVFVAVGTNGYIFTSSDCAIYSSWTSRESGTSTTLRD